MVERCAKTCTGSGSGVRATKRKNMHASTPGTIQSALNNAPIQVHLIVASNSRVSRHSVASNSRLLNFWSRIMSYNLIFDFHSLNNVSAFSFSSLLPDSRPSSHPLSHSHWSSASGCDPETGGVCDPETAGDCGFGRLPRVIDAPFDDLYLWLRCAAHFLLAASACNTRAKFAFSIK